MTISELRNKAFDENLLREKSIIKKIYKKRNNEIHSH
jgi:hypothetical protein